VMIRAGDMVSARDFAAKRLLGYDMGGSLACPRRDGRAIRPAPPFLCQSLLQPKRPEQPNVYFLRPKV